MFGTRGGEIGNSLVQVFTCQLGRFGGGGGAGCGAPAATTPGGGGDGAAATSPGGGTQTGTPSGNPFANFGFWDWAQLALDVLGFIPGVGEIADFINAIISAFRGDWAGAALSLAAMWPAGGQAATIAKISAKYGDEVAAVFRNLDDIIAGRRSADEVAGGARQVTDAATAARQTVRLPPCAGVAPTSLRRSPSAVLAQAGGCYSRFITGVRVEDIRTGRVFEGTVDLQPTLERIARGERFPHRNDGTTFRNREGRLPSQPEGYYTEYVHPTPGINGPGPQRIIIGRGGEVYYTFDHYGSFIRVNPPAPTPTT
jgi:hypothetical protein